MGDIMINVGDILSTVGMFSTMGDIMMHVGDIMSTMERYHPLKFEYRGGYHEYRGVFSTVGYSNNKRFPPTILNTLHSTHDIPHGIEHPHGTQDNSQGTHDIPHSTEHPTVLNISPTFIMIPARYLTPPRVLNTPTILHTHYTGC